MFSSGPQDAAAGDQRIITIRKLMKNERKAERTAGFVVFLFTVGNFLEGLGARAPHVDTHTYARTRTHAHAYTHAHTRA